MRVLIATAGGRGDVAPFTGLAAAVRAAGHSVTITSNDEYESLVVGCGLDFRPLPGTHGMFDDQMLMQDSAAPIATIRVIRRVVEQIRTVQKAVIAVARQEAPDVLALTGMATLGGYRIAKGLGLPGLDLLLQPAQTTADFAPSIVVGRSFGRTGNRLAGIATTAAFGALEGPAKQIRHELRLPRRRIREVLRGQPVGQRWPVLHGFSPAVVPRPTDWPESHQVTGYWWPERPAAWTPPAQLEDFLASGAPPVFFGFGDMTPDNTSDFIELAAEAGRQAGVRQVIQAEEAGPTAADGQQPGDSIVIGDVPHDWLFPRMAALVHHAGAGTAAAGFRAGVPAVAVPVLADQPFWAARIAALGAGPSPIPRRQLSAASLAAAIRDLVTRPSYRTRAEALSTQLAHEDGAAPVITMLESLSDDSSAG